MNDQVEANLASVERPLRVAVLGATGGIGRAMTAAVEDRFDLDALYTLSRSGESVASGEGIELDLTEDASIEAAGNALAARVDGLDLVINCAGLLHATDIAPEKSLSALRRASMEHAFAVNCMGPMLFMRAIEPLVRPDPLAVMAHISARVGSISDNRLGGWYSYRASKAALNMMLKTLSIEWARRRQGSVIAMFQPGTVDTDLSAPFLSGQKPENIQSPAASARHLVGILAALTPHQTGAFLDWRGETIDF